jgi:hypothetical protein
MPFTPPPFLWKADEPSLEAMIARHGCGIGNAVKTVGRFCGQRAGLALLPDGQGVLSASHDQHHDDGGWSGLFQ